MKDRSIVSRAAPLFFIASLFGAFAARIWLFVCEPPKNIGDGIRYLALYDGRTVPSPFGYRVLTPFLAHLLPWGAIANFSIVTISCLVITTGIIALYTARSSTAPSRIIITCMFWVTSFPFIHYTTTLIRVDGPTLLLIATVFLLSHRRVPAFILLFLIALGTMAHETILICIPALWIDKFLSGNLTGGKHYKYSQLLVVTLGSIAFAVFTRLFIRTIPGMFSYLDGFMNMFPHTLKHSGGWLKRALRIYTSYGPALLFAVFFVATRRSFNILAGFLGLFLLAVAATFLATDTPRVMAIIYLPVIFYAAAYMNELWQSGSRKTVFICLFLQLFYSFIVYGHVKSFETSLLLNSIAYSLSFIALVTCLFVTRFAAKQPTTKERL